MNEADVHGPIDLIVIQFPAGADASKAREAIADLVESGTIRLYDLMVVRKEDDGSMTKIDLSATAGGGFALEVFAGAASGLLGDSDLADAANLIDPGVMAALIVYENAWAIPFVAATRAAGGELVASSRLSAQDIMDALDVLDAEA